MKMFSKKSLLSSVVLSVIILLSFSSVGLAYNSSDLDYVAFGDSLAAGATPYGTFDKSYTDILAQRLRDERALGNYNNFGIYGATTSDVLNLFNKDSKAYVSTLIAVMNAEIITLDIGANDVLPVVQANPTDTVAIKAAIEKAASNMGKIIGTIKFINPKVKVYLMGYYNCFPYLPAEQKPAFMTLLSSFNEAIKIVAAKTFSTYVDTQATMDKNLTTYLPTTNIHPDISGYKAIANEFYDVIKVDFLRGSTRPVVNYLY